MTRPPATHDPPQPIDGGGRRKCTAHSSQTGNPCRNHAISGSNVCRSHGGAAPQVLERARRRLLEAVDPAAAELVRIAKQGENEGVRVRAITEILDRAGVPREARLEHTGPEGAPLIVRLWKPADEDDAA